MKIKTTFSSAVLTKKGTILDYMNGAPSVYQQRRRIIAVLTIVEPIIRLQPYMAESSIGSIECEQKALKAKKTEKG